MQNFHRVQTLPACHLANLTSLIGSIYVASAENGDDSIYNMSRPRLYTIKTLAQFQRLRHHFNFIGSQSYPKKSL